MARFRKKELVVSASQVEEDGVVDTSRGPRTVMVGDWVLTGDSGEKWVLSNFIFRSLYDAVDDEAKKMFERT